MQYLVTAFWQSISRPVAFLFLGAILLVTASGCDLLGEDDAFREGVVVAGTERAVPFSAYAPGGLDPKFSPDGAHVVFTEFDRELFKEVLYVLDVSKGTRRYLTDGRNADWSPDGAWIAFSCGVQICKIRADGTERQQLTQEGRNFFPDWSPDGQWITFDRSDAPLGQGVRLMRMDGSDERALFGGGAPDWHPSGDRIIAVIGVAGEGTWKKFAVYDRQSNAVQSVLDAVEDRNNWSPQFSPDGSRIVFENEDGIWVADADGRHLRRIVPNQYPHSDFASNERPPKLGAASPSWHPDGRHVVYEHFDITRYRMNDTGPHVEGSTSIRLIEVE